MIWALLLIPLTLLTGAWLAAALDARGPRLALAAGAALLTRGSVSTETPDRLTRLLAPATYLALAAIGLSVVPFWPGGALIESPVGIVIWGTCEALTVVAVFLHGWSPNAPFPLIGAYRYAAIGLPVMLPSMFVLIGAALPAESLSVTQIVEVQREGWLILQQPLGLPLFLITGFTLALRGPFDYADGTDIAGGTSAEESGPARALWSLARLSMLTAFSAMAATAFLGGPLGPWLPGPHWLLLKTAAILALMVLIGERFARLPPSRMLTALWVVALPVAFLHLAVSGAIALWL